MYINSITPTNFQAGIKILKSENPERTYLYNEINKLTNEFKIPATFKNREIELPSVSKAILLKLKELGIKISNK